METDETRMPGDQRQHGGVPLKEGGDGGSNGRRGKSVVLTGDHYGCPSVRLASNQSALPVRRWPG
jgi:hypothetical protein